MNVSETNKPILAAAGWVNVINVLLGLWVAVSPFVLGFSGNTAALWNSLTVGVALVLLALMGGWGSRAIQVWTVPLGAWLFISGFLLFISKTALLCNNAVMGFAVVAGAAISEGLRLGDNSEITPAP